MIKAILWDFDGVILDSMPIRGYGFEKCFAAYPKEQTDQLLAYHNANGGKSRFVKIRYFFEHIRNESITEEQILKYAELFSQVMLELLCDKKLLIDETVTFIEKNYHNTPMHIVSGSEQNELRFLCHELGLTDYFISIHGSPIEKDILVKNDLDKYGYHASEVILIGDSINDFDAAEANRVPFYGYNNPSLSKLNSEYITNFESFSLDQT